MAEWVFDRLTGNRTVRGGNPSTQVVKKDISTLVRETCQNSKDQRVDKTAKPVRLVYTLLELAGDDKKEFLEALDWPDLSKHLKSAAEGTGGVNAQLRKGLESLESKSIRLLKIDDYVTNGLEGGDRDYKKNFCLLCKSDFVTPSTEGRGGSYGLGKAVLWGHSGISTVLFSSIPKGEKELRLFGRSELSFHELDGNEFNNTGCFGIAEGDGPDTCAKSEWGNEKLAEDLRLSRDKDEGTGTSIVLVDFIEPNYDEDRPLEEVSRDIAEAAGKWFWPSISVGGPTLEVQVRAEDSTGAIKFDERVDPSATWKPFISAARDKVSSKQAKEPGEVAGKMIPFEIPERTADQKHDEFDTNLSLVVRKEDPELNDHPCANTIAAVRGAGMVVKYEKIEKPLDDIPCFGVLLVGSFKKRSKKDKSSEEFFRNAEPVLHDDWRLTATIRNCYKQGAGVRLKNLWKSLNGEAMKLVDQGVKRKKQGPASLAQLFPIGRSKTRQPSEKKIVTNIESWSFNGINWVVEGELVCKNFESKPWKTTIGFLADVDSGRGEYMKISEIELKPKKEVFMPTCSASPASISVTGNVDRLRFKVELESPDELETADLARTRIKFTH